MNLLYHQDIHNGRFSKKLSSMNAGKVQFLCWEMRSYESFLLANAEKYNYIFSQYWSENIYVLVEEFYFRKKPELIVHLAQISNQVTFTSSIARFLSTSNPWQIRIIDGISSGSQRM
jgi:hypothetical protein